MDLKVNEVQQTAPVQQTQTAQPTDDSFRFMLASNIEEAGLAVESHDGRDRDAGG